MGHCHEELASSKGKLCSITLRDGVGTPKACRVAESGVIGHWLATVAAPGTHQDRREEMG